MTLNVQIDPLALHYSEVIRPDQYDDGSIAYVAEIPELPGCKSHGATVEEARQNLADAQREYLEALSERGLPIPAPSTSPSKPTVVWTISFQEPVPERKEFMAPSVIRP